MGVEFSPQHGTRLRLISEVGDPFVGRVLDGRYRVDSVLGRGGMGVVYLGRQVNVDRPVAIKVLSRDAAQREDIVRRFEREARIISRLRHPNTLKLIDFGHTPEGVLYIVNPLLEGRPLDVVLQQDRALTVERTLRMMRQVCDALAEAHALGIVHRDLKPGNVFSEIVGDQEVFKVLDFGIAKLSEETTGHTGTGSAVGTPATCRPSSSGRTPTWTAARTSTAWG